MLIKYCARATDSVFPVMLMVLSRLAGASLSSQFEIRIIAPESCLRSSKIFCEFSETRSELKFTGCKL